MAEGSQPLPRLTVRNKRKWLHHLQRLLVVAICSAGAALAFLRAPMGVELPLQIGGPLRVPSLLRDAPKVVPTTLRGTR